MKSYAIPAEVACASVEDGAVVLHMGTKRYFSLNETGAVIWGMLEADVSLADIPRRLSEGYDVGVDEARIEVDGLITLLGEKNLLILGPE